MLTGVLKGKEFLFGLQSIKFQENGGMFYLQGSHKKTTFTPAHQFRKLAYYKNNKKFEKYIIL